MIKAVGIIVPAHNEQDLLPACLASLRRAAQELPGTPVHLVVVADACSDLTDTVARRGGATVVAITARSAGVARAAGAREILGRTQHLDPADVWLATTDADSVVPRGWVREQVTQADQGWDAVAGTVQVADWAGFRPQTRVQFLERYSAAAGTGQPSQPQRAGIPLVVGVPYPPGYSPAPGHPHVHGANLGFRASAYLLAGGFPSVPTAEDHAIIDALTAQGGRVLRTRALPVVTSARREARAPLGFGHYLAELDRATAMSASGGDGRGRRLAQETR